MTDERRFLLAGLTVLVRGDIDHMAGHYDACEPVLGAPHVLIAVERRDDFHVGRERGPTYPAFEAEPVVPGTTRFSRFDAEGTISVADNRAVMGAFVVGASPNSLEAAMRIAISTALPLHGGLIFHASSVAGADGVAQLFLGLSGAGKSTISTMLADHGATKVSDELVIVTKDDSGWVAEVTPFIGSAGLPHGQRFPLGALNFLIQAPEHQRRPIDTRAALPQLLRHTVTFGREVVVKTAVLDLAAALASEVPCYELEFAKRPDVADAILLTC